MRTREWYFHGWELRRTPDGKSKYVYTAEYYHFPGGMRRARLHLALPTAGLLLLFWLVACHPAEGGMWRPSAIPQLLELIPLLYLVIGLVCCFCVKEPMTFRAWYSSLQCVKKSALFSCLFTGAMAVLEIIYLLAVAEKPHLLRELLYLLGQLGCAAFSLYMALYLRRHPCAQTAGQS